MFLTAGLRKRLYIHCTYAKADVGKLATFGHFLAHIGVNSPYLDKSDDLSAPICNNSSDKAA